MFRCFKDAAATHRAAALQAMRGFKTSPQPHISSLNSYQSRLPSQILRCGRSTKESALGSHILRQYTTMAPQPQSQGHSTHPVPSPPDPSSGAESFTAKPYDAIPTPKRIPLLGMSRDFMKFSPSQTVNFIRGRVENFGKIFREKLAPGLPEFLFVLDPEDVAKVFRADGKYPRRLPFSDWINVRNELNIPHGLFLSEGEKWESQRKPMSKFMLVPKKLGEYHGAFSEVVSDLIDILRKERGEENMFLNVPGLLNRWSFESICVFVLGKRLGCLEQEMPANCKRFIDAVNNFIVTTQELQFGLPFHKFVSTKNWKALAKSQQCMYDVAMGHIQEKVAQVTEEEKRLLEEGGEDDEPPVGVDFITFMMHAGKMDLDTMTMNAVDLMAAGIDTTAGTLSWTLYCLATNPNVQEKLRSVVEEVVGSDELVTPQHIARMPYLHDCIRETQRLYPVAPNNFRLLEEDVVLSGYKVPAGTCVIMPISVAGTLPENFPEPEKFKPERWSRKNKDAVNVFGSLPFGFGVRMCIGRRVAELEMHIALAQLIRNFRLEYREEQPLNFVQKMFIYPERQMDLAFVNCK